MGHRMTKKEYWQFENLKDFYFEDSYLLDVSIFEDIEIVIEAVLRESHPFYTKPLVGEKYCYHRSKIIFKNVTGHYWIKKNLKPILDPLGIPDYGNIDEFYYEEDRYVLKGEWGHLEIMSEIPVVFLM
jgi:hypothetical protein